ncbi:MAG: BREX system P-loop protein BrxC [Clostridium sp.]|uniref:BREX system P-loop protein BrxC n=1 Tax=Clostridium sp. TaxID=1506 RepID=UPI0029026E8F|nr:BREX system P-loop protein BrxC [Clostridium sp.]MDU1180602.1 BREX system P-loop protein BrxC [Clostridium sp.]MDU1227901.1 BREX system P-loop protein BrxC [Clostridium sp.]MDU7653880.1 BREX system P-loop protein BrxC [Clostridium sp.]
MDIKLKSMFYKDINRDIKGVIKVGQADEENVKQELEEYVVTGELNKHIDRFFEAYKTGIVSHTDKNGVWISGFFGSGKSHFLKILSYLLENKEIEGKRAINYFDDKGLDSFILANMKVAGDISSDVILFNIDSKSDSKSKLNKDAIVNVFNKVFNEMQGFCGTMPWLADLERQMVKDGVYDEFKKKFKEIRGDEWEKFRSNFYFEEDAIVEALAETTRMSVDAARNWYNKAENNYSLSIDDFANKVKEYCDSKGKNHHVVFLVDEIGQYIGDNTQLMLNLQTVVEDLGTKCQGKCWVIVTSQEGLDEFTKVKGNDFSKIQGRFNTRLSLSSANVDEVIKKRILRKTEGATSHLKALYEQKESIIKNLLTFTSDTAEMKLYKDSEEFAEVYPFIPYQFNLLQSAFNGVREHGASGKSLSKGERSLLGAYQQVAVDYMESDSNILIPFSAFYKTIETFLDSSIRSVVMNAEKNDRLDKFDVEVLKLLFLVKYVKEIKANINNLATLLVDNIDVSHRDLAFKVKESLKKLIRETLVQENGEEYVFLTNDEQDVNKEIKNMNVDNGEIIQKVGEIIFDDIYKDNKYNYSKKYMFTFNKIVDDRTRGPQNNEIGVRVTTANFDLIGGGGTSQSELKQLSIRENNVIVNISRYDNFLDEIRNVLKIDAYLRLKGSTKSTASIEDIKTKKSREREDRLKRAKFLIEEAIKSAEIYVNGSLLDIKEKGAVDRINEGLRALIDSKYNKLNYIKDFKENTKDLYDLMDKRLNQMSLMDSDPNRLAIDEIKTHIETSTARNLQVTVKGVINKFSIAPYGWKEIDIEGVIVTLFKRQDIKVVFNNEVLAPNSREIVNYVDKKDYKERVILKTREKVPTKYIDALKDLNKDLFGFSSMPSDEDGMMSLFKEHSRTELHRIEVMLNNFTVTSRYPGEDILKKGRELFKDVIEVKDTLEFFKKVYDLEEDFLDYVDEIDNIKGFFFKKENGTIDTSSKGEQRVIFDNAIDKLKNYEDNKEYIVNDEIKEIVEEIKTILRMKEPYLKIPTIPLLIEKYNNKILSLLEEESVPVLGFIETCKKEVIETLDGYDFKDKFISEIIREFDNLTNRTESANNFAVLSSMSDRAEKLKLKWVKEIVTEDERQKRIKAKEIELASSVKEAPESAGNNTECVVEAVKPEPEVVIRTKTLSMRELVKGQKVIKNDSDIDQVIEALRRKLKEELEKDTIITLI